MRATDCYGLVDALVAMAAEAGRSRDWADRFWEHPREYPGCFGWQMVGRLAMEGGTTKDDDSLDRLGGIERRIHAAPNALLDGLGDRGPQRSPV